MVLDDILGLLSPFAEAFAQQLTIKTAPEAQEIGRKGGAAIGQALLGTKTTADDQFIRENATALVNGFIDGLNNPGAIATDPDPAPTDPAI